MNIVCPQCGFSREVPADRLPARAVIVTCPKCECRFRFSAEEGVLETLPPVADDPLPPGAIIPGRSEPVAEPAGIAGSLEASSQGASTAAHTARPSAEDAARAEEERRRNAQDAYAREAARLDEREAADRQARQARQDQQDERDAIDGDDAMQGTPWDVAPAPDGWPAAFYQTVTKVMFAPVRFFADLRPSKNQLRPLCFFLLVGVVQILMESLWTSTLHSMITQAAVSDAQLERLATLLAPQLNIFMTLLLRGAEMTFKLYLFCALVHMTYHFLVPGRANFSLIFQIMAYGAAPALLSVVPFIGSIAGMVWGLALVLVGCRVAFNLSWSQTLLGFTPIVLIVAPVLLQIYNFGAGV